MIQGSALLSIVGGQDIDKQSIWLGGDGNLGLQSLVRSPNALQMLHLYNMEKRFHIANTFHCSCGV